MGVLSSVLHWIFPVFRGVLFGMLAMGIHECGHLIAARVLGVDIKNVTVQWKGICIVRHCGPPLKNLFISLSGPLVNFILILTWISSPLFGFANLCFAFFNLIPIEGSDGARALECWEQVQQKGI